MGLGGSLSITEVIFDRNQYYLGDKCTVKIICDNTNCNSGVKSFKIKLKRKVFASGERASSYSDRESQVIKTSKYLYS